MEILWLKPHLLRYMEVEYQQRCPFFSSIITQLGYFNLNNFMHFFFYVTAFLFNGKEATKLKKKQAQTNSLNKENK